MVNERELEDQEPEIAPGSGERGGEADTESAARARRTRELVNQGARLLSLRRPGEAAKVLEEAYALAPEDIEVAINLGGAYIMQERFAQAISVLEAASKRAPDNSMVWTNLAAAYLGRLESSTREMQDKAIAAFEQALRVDPTAPNVNYNLGLIYKQRGDWERACAHFWRALEVNPQDRDAQWWLDRIQQTTSMDAPDDPSPASEEPGSPEGRSE